MTRRSAHPAVVMLALGELPPFVVEGVESYRELPLSARPQPAPLPERRAPVPWVRPALARVH